MEDILYLIGTDHKYQHNSERYISVPKNEIEEFVIHLKTICENKNIRAIGEEFHETHLKEDRKLTIPKNVAVGLNIKHIYCEPDDDEAEKLGYVEKLLQRPRETTEEFYKRAFENEKIREKGWLNRLISNKVWPLLFVCGSWHVESFKNLLEANQIKVVIINENWPIK